MSACEGMSVSCGCRFPLRETVKTDMKTHTHTHSLGNGAHTHQQNGALCLFVVVVLSQGLRLVGCCEQGRCLCDLQDFQD